MLFSRWGAFVYRRRRPIALVTIVLAVLFSTLAAKATGALSSGGWSDPTSESTAVGQQLAADFGTGQGSIVALFQGSASTDARSLAFQGTIATSLRRLLADPLADGSVGYAQARDDRFISTDGHSAYAVVQLTITDEQAANRMPEIRALIDPPADATLKLAGVGPFTEDQAHQSERELVQAETISGPFALLILLAVFASLVAAGLPLLVAALTIPTTLGGVYLAAQVTELSIYVQNVATMLGLALAIDYSLFMVSRFREELRKGRSVADAVEVTVATSGKAVTFSGLAVAIGLSGLLLFRPAALRSFGIGGAPGGAGRSRSRGSGSPRACPACSSPAPPHCARSGSAGRWSWRRRCSMRSRSCRRCSGCSVRGSTRSASPGSSTRFAGASADPRVAD